ncbi:unnamed protein product [Mytilus edulis]|uniref:C-type lectin domain-containing protein n=1 Tax=Mytilus edulis TaxID=6550 RepID=A0A8S3Q492_MYTED|nr:unnamed protein product [Mytilus edulis]
MIALLVVLVATYVQVLKKTISDLEKGLKEKHIVGNNGCSKDWDRFRDHCYFVSKHKKSWFEAERFCRSKGSSLVNIKDDNENNWVMSKFKEAKVNNAWLGATDCDSDKWIWVLNFEPVKYFKWDGNEPNGGSGENCLEMYPNSGGGWNDKPCKIPLDFICKKHVVSAY